MDRSNALQSQLLSQLGKMYNISAEDGESADTLFFGRGRDELPVHEKVMQKIAKVLYHPTSMQRLRDVFRKFDVDHSGSISHEELRKALLQEFDIYLTDPDFAAVVPHFDHDNSGEITFKEFKLALAEARSHYASTTEKEDPMADSSIKARSMRSRSRTKKHGGKKTKQNRDDRTRQRQARFATLGVDSAVGRTALLPSLLAMTRTVEEMSFDEGPATQQQPMSQTVPAPTSAEQFGQAQEQIARRTLEAAASNDRGESREKDQGGAGAGAGRGPSLREQQELWLSLSFEEQKAIKRITDSISALLHDRKSLMRTRDVFNAADTDRDGNVSKKEFLESLVGSGVKLSMKELNVLWPSFDKNADGQLSYNEFLGIDSYKTDFSRSDAKAHKRLFTTGRNEVPRQGQSSERSWAEQGQALLPAADDSASDAGSSRGGHFLGFQIRGRIFRLLSGEHAATFMEEDGRPAWPTNHTNMI